MAGGTVLDWAGHAEVVGQVSLTSSNALRAVGVAGKLNITFAVVKDIPRFAAEASSRVAGGTGIKALKNYFKLVGCIIFDNFVPFIRLNAISLNLYSTAFIP